MARKQKQTVDSKLATPEGLNMTALLANERILAQWCQTSVLLQIGGFALTQLGSSTLRGPVGTLLILAGAAVAVAGYQRYSRFGQAVRGIGDDTFEDRRPLLQVTVVAGVAVLMAGLQIAGIW